VLYECASYKKPFTGENHGALIRSILEEEPQSLREAIAEFPERLEKVVQRALCKDKSARYPNVEMLLADLEPIWLELQQSTIQQLVTAGRELIGQGKASEACLLLRQASLIDGKNATVKALLDELYASVGEDQAAARVRDLVARAGKLLEEELFFDGRVEACSERR